MISPGSNSPDPIELGELTAQILDLVDTVPAGFVVSYGDLAALVDTGPRQVGQMMARYGHLTSWWRVVRADGTSAVADRAAEHWDDEGIAHRAGRVKMQAHRYQWDGNPNGNPND